MWSTMIGMHGTKGGGWTCGTAGSSGGIGGVGRGSGTYNCNARGETETHIHLETIEVFDKANGNNCSSNRTW